MKNKISIGKENIFSEILISADEDPYLKGILERQGNFDHTPIVYDQKLVGFYSPKTTQYNNKTYWRTGAIFILPEYRKLGIASRVINEFFKGKDRGMALIEQSNIASQKTFEKIGFIRDKLITGKITCKPTWIYLKEFNNEKPSYSKW